MRSMTRQSALGFTFALTLLGGCRDITGSTVAQLASARERWAANGPASYDFTISLSCFCATDALRPVVVVVNNGVVQSRKYADTGADVSPPFSKAYSPIEELFGIVEDAQARNAAQLDVTYDPARGYPASIDIDYVAMAVDDEISYSVRDFHVR
ncbi:MAG: DUF6174 domain-containing protein [bacterium]